MVEQNADIALGVADRVVVLSQGQVAWTGEAAALAADPALKRQLLGGAAMSAAPLLALKRVSKVYRRGLLDRTPAFRLDVDRALRRARRSSACMGPNGAGKTTLFEMIAGSNAPTGGPRRGGRAGHPARALPPARPARHPLSPVLPGAPLRARRRPAFMLEPAGSAYPLVHLFDEPQFNTQDGYIGFMLDFFRRLRARGPSGLRLPAPDGAVPARDPARDLRALPVRRRRHDARRLRTSMRWSPMPTFAAISGASRRSPRNGDPAKSGGHSPPAPGPGSPTWSPWLRPSSWPPQDRYRWQRR